ncbi:putative ABC transporter, permease protein [Winogradskyella psychrotolerans RS-3]|uniref:Putative ABC transporter, permease protein n=1 Tax=Winogradskyella psychrotolerans RS-3 TaxID=641526 RepID=S7WTS6_9FLAO|nr:TIGR02206 family membrane protein [Winogradskyella psychrotolerans]EPR70129.1 putative ABC transporter, permease protein [Winogradskyella psychrotolerans RS-3]
MSVVILCIVLSKVTIGSFQHLFPILCGVIGAVFVIRYVNKSFCLRQKQKTIHYLGWFVSLTLIGFHVYRILFDNYNFKTDLPLYLCSLMALLIPVFTYYRKYWMFEVLVFLIIGGTLQGVITPDIANGFPSFDYFRYWTVHLGLLSIIFYFIFVFKMKPTLRSVFKSFLALQVYVVLMVGVNYVLDANYFYLNEKPKSASLLDYFGEWPYYIMVGQLIIMPLFLMIYLPFLLLNKRMKSLSK